MRWDHENEDNDLKELLLQLSGKLKKLKSDEGSKLAKIVDTFLRNPRTFSSSEIMGSQTPTSIWEANAVYFGAIQKYQVAALAGQLVQGHSGYCEIVWCWYNTHCHAGHSPLLDFFRKILFKGILKSPLALPPLTNYTILAGRMEAKTFIGREDIFKKISEAWDEGMHPILIGPPGVGKTSILVRFAQKIYLGEIERYKEMTLWAGSAAVLANGGGSNSQSHLERVVNELKPYKKTCILGLDEIHALDSKDKEFLKSVTDGQIDSLPFCIFLTTPEGYRSFIENPKGVNLALVRRFKPIEIKPLEKLELLKLLQEEAKIISSQLTVTEKGLEAIWEHAQGKMNETRQLLYKVLREAESINELIFHSNHRKRDLKKIELERLTKQSHEWNQSLDEKVAIIEKIDQLKKDINIVEIDCKKDDKIQDFRKNIVINLIKNSIDRQSLSRQIQELLKNHNDTKIVNLLEDGDFLKRTTSY